MTHAHAEVEKSSKNVVLMPHHVASFPIYPLPKLTNELPTRAALTGRGRNGAKTSSPGNQTSLTRLSLDRNKSRGLPEIEYRAQKVAGSVVPNMWVPLFKNVMQ
jgi:hypothetical protein